MFGKYALLRPFARGGMGEIYLAAHGEVAGAEKLCLVKKVPEDRDAPGLTARLLDEATLAHPARRRPLRRARDRPRPRLRAQLRRPRPRAPRHRAAKHPHQLSRR